MKVKSLKYLTLTFLILSVLWAAIPLRIAGNKIKKTTPHSNVLDLQPRPEAGDVMNYLTGSGIEGRGLLKEMYTFYDLVYPILYGAFFFFAILYFARRAYPTKDKLKWLSLISIILVIVDFTENFSILHLINTYPAGSAIAGSLYIVTISKWVLVLVNFSIVIILGIRAIMLKRLLKKAAN